MSEQADIDRAIDAGYDDGYTDGRREADARKPYADLLKSVQELSQQWMAQASELQREVSRRDISTEVAIRKAERAAGLRTAALELRRVLGVD